MIYDGRRGYGIFYDLHDVQFVEADFDEAVRSSSVSGVYADDEKVFQDLWRNYFNSTNIKSRKNNKLHLRHIPKRYWRYLTEKL
jgi:probable DNA metabolism protein